MFKHPGKSLKGFGIAIFFVIIVGGFLGGAIFGDPIGHSEDYAFFGLIIGFFLGWLLSIILIAFGELVENSTTIREHMATQYYMNNSITPQQLPPVQQTSVICPNCSSQIAGWGSFCEKCGARIK